jgi:hypothetical protein
MVAIREMKPESPNTGVSGPIMVRRSSSAGVRLQKRILRSPVIFTALPHGNSTSRTWFEFVDRFQVLIEEFIWRFLKRDPQTGHYL